jgi:hypothetical protein
LIFIVVIAYNYNGKVIAVVNAISVELAQAFWQGRGVVPHIIKTLKNDFTPLSEHPTGVYPIVETLEIVVGSLRDDAKILCIK